ncbi:MULTISPECIES: type VII secretion integral membrane protein EccD [unclassified Mycolicibacterium]|uniref:type VII secretion integral membrane protein EccD n=1 Tax=unclassified Mycolicibacterium TaxID=2636767 RepID=UPI0012DF1517|nr:MULTISPECIES: type VII secretion integral membrane protein EccD [unclassified Mycolicibacterium]MUL81353.1 type VII secretion integral membrane protein EccD [Mycolicibacterium sp. CBMA 329]MUL87119.1 type VII secretion integral membrane protein EccD [Mycolicibacterium sp. CBMA 331]MUL98599.1 type VII secretion integral membrane protein EccD [Mycolicibacterium sp. CBMA 334]MUM28333.1 type VII secretion integral membrane protein EccD [Mycolicibacterium sp. CBMA 295]MUM37416.1 type VII secreti
MPDSLRHVSIHCGPPTGAGHSATIDLSLPTAMTVGELLPWIVDALGVGDGTPRRWQLAHLGGRSLDESATVVQNDIRDGDLLILAGFGEQPRLGRPVIAALTADSPDDNIPTGLRIAGCLWACALGIMALTWAGLGSHGLGRIAATAAVTVAATAIAAAAPRLGLDSIIAATLNVAAVAQAAILGFLVVPAGPAPANFFLAAVAAGSLGAVLVRVSGCGTEILLAVVTAAGLIAVATGCAALWPLATPALGAVLSALGVGLLPLTPRLSIALAGLTPPVPGYPGSEEDVDALGDNAFDVDARALSGHRNLVGLVVGCSTAAALGAATLAIAGLRRATAVEVAFVTAVGVALLLRSRTYASGRCRTASIICGFFSLTAAFVLVVAWVPGHGSWTGMLAVGAGISMLWPVTVQNPMAARIADALEYGALAAVVPLACWIAGAFDLVRGLGLW